VSNVTRLDDALGVEVQPEDDYFDLMADVAATHWWYRARRDRMAKELAGRFRPGGRAIDVGTGTAESFTTLLQLGAGTIVGTDLSMVALRHARGRRPPPPVLACLADPLPFASASADVLTCTEVVEHLDDDVGAMTEFARVLKPGQPCFITTSSYAFLWSEHDVRAAHRRRYTLRRFRVAVEDAGLEIDRLCYYYSFLVPLAILSRKTPLGRLVKETDEETSSMHPALDTMFYGMAKVETWLAMKGVPVPFGLSMLCVAHRPAA